MSARMMQSIAVAAMLVVVTAPRAAAQPIPHEESLISKAHPPQLSVSVAVEGFWPVVAFLDDERVLIGGEERSQFEIRAAKTGALLQRFPEKRNNRVLRDFRLSADRRWLAATTWPKGNAEEANITVWDLSTGKVRGSVSCPAGTLLDITPEGRRVALYTAHDCATLQKVHVLASQLIGAGALVRGITLGTAVGAIDGLVAESTKDHVEVWDIAAGKRVRTSPFVFHGVDVAAFSPDGAWLVVSGRNDLAYWKWQGDDYRRLHVGRRICALAFSPDSRFLAEGPDSRETIEIRDLGSLKVVQALKVAQTKSKGVCPWLLAGGVAFHNDGRTLIAANAIQVVESLKVPHRLQVWDVPSGKPQREIAVDYGRPVSLAVAPGGRSLAVLLWTSKETRLAMWDLANE